MISYFAKHAAGGYLQTAKPYEHTAWVYGSNVSEQELISLSRHYHLDLNIIRDVRDANELPRIEYGTDGAIYLFLRVPRSDRKGEMRTTPLLVISSGRLLMTLGYGGDLKADDLADRLSGIKGTSRQLALIVFAQVLADYEELVHHSAKVIRDINLRLRSHDITNKDFLQFVAIEDNLNDFTTNLDGLRVLARHIKENRRGVFVSGDIEMADDLSLHAQQLLVAVASQIQSVKSIRDAHSTIANNNLNHRVGVLTTITVLLTLPNVVFGMYGMNIDLPLEEEPLAYPIIVVFTIMLIMLVYWLARRSKLF